MVDINELYNHLFGGLTGIILQPNCLYVQNQNKGYPIL